MVFFYSAYGMVLCADVPLPGLVRVPAQERADIHVWLKSTPPWAAVNESAGEYWYRNSERTGLRIQCLAQGSYLRLTYRDGTRFVLDWQGTRIWATWPTVLTLEDTVTYLVGPVMGTLLYLRGVTCLHASAVSVGHRAVALLGAPGAGKSTTAAAFAKLGYAVLSDDVVPLAECEGAFWLHPGYPRVCLWPPSVVALYGSSDALPPITPTWDKRYLDLTRNGCRFQSQPVPLAAIYCLSERRTGLPAPVIEGLPGTVGLLHLLANTYGNYLPDVNAMRAQQFHLFGRIVVKVPVRCVYPHAEPEKVFRLCEAIIRDLETLAPSHTPI
jgi:hypothetical protein